MAEAQDLHQIEYRHHATRDLFPVASSMSAESLQGWHARIQAWVRHPHAERLSESVCYQIFSNGQAVLALRLWDQRAAERADGTRGRPLVSRVIVGPKTVLTGPVAIALCRAGLPADAIGPAPGDVPDGARLPTVPADAVLLVAREQAPELDKLALGQPGLQALVAAALAEPALPLAVTLRDTYIQRPLREGVQPPLLWGLIRVTGPILGRVGRGWSFSTYELPLGETDPATLPAIVFRQAQEGQQAPPARHRKELKVRPYDGTALQPGSAYSSRVELAGWLIDEYQERGAAGLRKFIESCGGTDSPLQTRMGRVEEELRRKHSPLIVSAGSDGFVDLSSAPASGPASAGIDQLPAQQAAAAMTRPGGAPAEKPGAPADTPQLPGTATGAVAAKSPVMSEQPETRRMRILPSAPQEEAVWPAAPYAPRHTAAEVGPSRPAASAPQAGLWPPEAEQELPPQGSYDQRGPYDQPGPYDQYVDAGGQEYTGAGTRADRPDADPEATARIVRPDSTPSGPANPAWKNEKTRQLIQQPGGPLPQLPEMDRVADRRARSGSPSTSGGWDTPTMTMSVLLRKLEEAGQDRESAQKYLDEIRHRDSLDDIRERHDCWNIVSNTDWCERVYQSFQPAELAPIFRLVAIPDIAEQGWAEPIGRWSLRAPMPMIGGLLIAAAEVSDDRKVNEDTWRSVMDLLEPFLALRLVTASGITNQWDADLAWQAAKDFKPPESKSSIWNSLNPRRRRQ